MLWVQEHDINEGATAKCENRPSPSNVLVGAKKGSTGIVTYSNADTAGRYKGTQAYGNGLNNPSNLKTTESQSGYSRGYTLKRSNYLGRIDINDYREHCTSAAAWTSLWYHFPPFKLTALYQGNDKTKALPYGQRKKVLICFRGFGCESKTYTYEFTVQRGCPAGKYEDPSIRWIRKRTYYEFAYAYAYIYISISISI